LQANERFCSFIGRYNENIAGHTHQEVFGGSLKPDQQFWEEVQTNLHYKGVEQIKIGKKTVTLKEHFTTVQNRDGIIVKYINFATE